MRRARANTKAISFVQRAIRNPEHFITVPSNHEEAGVYCADSNNRKPFSYAFLRIGKKNFN
jgi:hypothetical protein